MQKYDIVMIGAVFALVTTRLEQWDLKGVTCYER